MPPRTFKTEQDFIQAMRDYIEYCVANKRMPNIAGFCAFKDINRDTFYAQATLYSDTYKKARDVLEDGVINTNADINDALKIFYMKNAFGYVDRVESTVKTIDENPLDLSKLSDTEIKKLKRLTEKARKE